MKGDVSAAVVSGRPENKENITSVTFLMPVWGYRFTGRFLEFCLPTLLAPNNIPALAGELPCRFVLLSSENDEPVIRAHPAWQRLAQLCAVEIQLIDDLITHANHTATITLAFERALRQAGKAMRHTCFFFLMSDYLVADGSFKTVLATIRKGARGVLVGNFQVTAEDAAPLLRAASDRASPEIILRPRELMQWSLAHLHPATAANIVNFGLSHNAHANRLFWRVDESSLIGRFYLMHAIAIHPEVTDFVIGSSWDYSFIPELCPSGNVTTITDSDDYLVVELQPRDYESGNLRPGPIDATALAASLSFWATANHRANIERTLVFHAGDRPPNLPEIVAQSDAFVQSVRALLTTPPVSHRGHPYWVGSLAMSRWRSSRPLNRQDWTFVFNDRPPPSQLGAVLQQTRAKLFGFPPAVTRLHPWWPEYELPVKALNQVLSAKGRILMVAQDSGAYAQWVMQAAGDAVTIDSDELLQMPRVVYTPLVGTFDACFLTASEGMLDTCDTLIGRVGPLLKPGGKIHVLVYNDRPLESASKFAAFFASQAARLLQPTAWIADVHYVESGRFRWSVRRAAEQLLVNASVGMSGSLASAVLFGGPVLLATYLSSWTAKVSRTPPLAAICSSVFLTLQAPERMAQVLPRFHGEAAIDHEALPARESGGLQAVTPEECFGIERLGLTTSEPWQNDPAQFTSTVAAYRFVAKLMSGRHDVAEFGFASELGTRLVLRQVRELRVFDPRQLVIGQLQRYFGEALAFEARLHDILAGPLPRQFDAIYSVDFIQYLSPDEEVAFVRNLRASLARDFDFVLIGCPSYRDHGGQADQPSAKSSGTAAHPSAAARLQQQILPPRSTARQSLLAKPSRLAETLDSTGEAVASGGMKVYRRTGEELTALMQQQFHNVFPFSMIDDVVQPGIHPNAQHAFVLGCGKNLSRPQENS
jgi:hypothetical protein